MKLFNDNLIPISLRRAFQLDEMVVRTISSQQRTCMLKVLTLSFACQSSVHGLAIPVCKQNTPIRIRQFLRPLNLW